MQARIQKALAKRQAGEGGFTLIELLVVIVIIGILAAIAIPAFLNQREKAWQKAVESDLRNLAVQIETDGVDASGAFKQNLVDGVVTAFQTNDAGTSASEGVTISATVDSDTAFTLTASHTSIDADKRGGASNPITYISDQGGLQTD